MPFFSARIRRRPSLLPVAPVLAADHFLLGLRCAARLLAGLAGPAPLPLAAWRRCRCCLRFPNHFHRSLLAASAALKITCDTCPRSPSRSSRPSAATAARRRTARHRCAPALGRSGIPTRAPAEEAPPVREARLDGRVARVLLAVRLCASSRQRARITVALPASTFPPACTSAAARGTGPSAFPAGSQGWAATWSRPSVAQQRMSLTLLASGSG
jgi:hypothetical protein